MFTLLLALKIDMQKGVVKQRISDPHQGRCGSGFEGVSFKIVQVDHRHDMAQPCGAEQIVTVF